ncbi:MAG: hypothetical protein ACOYMS_11760 [Terrimicrobiaceae bacterium]
MIIATLIVCFLLAFLPLVISAFALRYAANVFSRSIFGLSAVSFLIGLAQTGLLVGLSYRLFESEQMKQANLALQYVSIVGGSIMIVAGALWVGYFRVLMKSRPMKGPEPVRAERQPPVVEPAASEPVVVQPAAEETSAPQPAAGRRRKKPEPERDWFSDEVPGARAFKAAATPPKSVPVRRPSARSGGAKPKTQRGS